MALHLYRFHDEEALARNLGAVAACAESFIVDPAALEQIEAGPYLVIGEGPWGERFNETLTQGLERSAAGGA